jgi:hypothetical protein
MADVRRWLRLWPGMQDEVVFQTDSEVIAAVASTPEEEEAIRNAKIGEWVCDGDGYYIRLFPGPIFGNYFVPR